MTLGKSLTLSELQFPHLLSKDINSHLTGLAWDFKIIYIKCLCFIERAIVIASNGFGTGLYLGTAEERKRAEREVGTLITHSIRNFSGPATCWAMLGNAGQCWGASKGLSLSPCPKRAQRLGGS